MIDMAGIVRLNSFRAGIYKHSFGFLLGMQSFTLPYHYQCRSDSEGADKDYKSRHYIEQAVTEYESYDGSPGSGGSPVDIASLDAHELKGFLKPLENRVRHVFLFLTSCHSGSGNAEEEGQGLGCRNQEDTCAHDHHDLLLDILLLVVHSDVDADGSDHGHDSGNRVA